MELAQDEVNAAGGVLGRKIEIVSRDDNGTPGDAVRVAEELAVARERVDAADGNVSRPTWASPSRISRSSARFRFSLPNRSPTRSSGSNGNRYTFRLRASTFMQTAMLVPEAAKLGKKRWAIVYPNYEYGQSATAAFKKQMNFRAVRRARVHRDRGAAGQDRRRDPVVQALIDAQPDAIFSSLFGADLARFVREGQLRGLFKDRPVFNLLGGEPEYLDPAEGRGAGRLVRHRLSVVCHRHAGAQALPRRLREALRRLSAAGIGGRLQHGDRRSGGVAQGGIDGPGEDRRRAVGTRPFRRRSAASCSVRSTTSRRWAPTSGRTAQKDGKGVMVDWRYADGKDYLPSDADVQAMRPQ